jgi:hypothetical protein
VSGKLTRDFQMRLQPGVGTSNATVSALLCDQQEKYGFLEPMDWHSSPGGETGGHQ